MDSKLEKFHPEKMFEGSFKMLGLSNQIDKMTDNEYQERKAMFFAGLTHMLDSSLEIGTAPFTQDEFNVVMRLWQDELKKFWVRRVNLYKQQKK